jgi:hypothetical protein
MHEAVDVGRGRPTGLLGPSAFQPRMMRAHTLLVALAVIPSGVQSQPVVCSSAALKAAYACCGVTTASTSAATMQCGMLLYTPGALKKTCATPQCTNALATADSACVAGAPGLGKASAAAAFYRGIRSVVSCKIDQCEETYASAAQTCGLSAAAMARGGAAASAAICSRTACTAALRREIQRCRGAGNPV